MAKISYFVLIAIFISGTVTSYKLTVESDPPKFGDLYTVSGILQLPYAEIKEPFQVWFDAANKKSKTSYYNGNYMGDKVAMFGCSNGARAELVMTIQRGDLGPYGISYKIASFTNDSFVTNQNSCFQVNGTVNATVSIQGILPDLTGFKMINTEIMDGEECNVWQKVDIEGKKKNTYIMYVKTTNSDPVRYEMRGYDTLLGSHYDRYYLDYMNYNTNKIPADTFETPKGLKCAGFPGPGVTADHISMSPMREFVHHEEHHIHEGFQHFKTAHQKAYSNEAEHEMRKHHFRQNLRYINSMNRAGLTYKLAVNHLADRSDEEFKAMRGYRFSQGAAKGAQQFNINDFDLTDIPDEMDWRLYGAVTPVKDQAVCGSCWSFGTTGTIEGANFLKTGNLIRLSQQELMDCSWGEGNNGCDGGEDFRSYEWIMKNGGLSSEEQYGQYLAVDGRCHAVNVSSVVNLKGYVNVTMYDQNALKVAIAKQGPISVGIDAAHKSLSFYANGVYYEPKCGSKPDDLDHAVLAVGFGTMNGQDYWLVKNSWSTYWGNDGYVLMSLKDNNCGVATSPSYVLM